MSWFEITIVSILFGTKKWFEDKKLSSFLKDFIIAYIFFACLKLIFSYIELPDIPAQLQIILFVAPIVFVTIVLFVKVWKQKKIME